jgi:large subunit ribosomal protein L3
MKGILGRKIGMTQIFDEDGTVVPVTVIEAGPCFVVQRKTLEKDGYTAIQIGFEEVEPRKLSRPRLGHLGLLKATEKHAARKQLAEAVPPLRYLREIRVSGVDGYYEGQKLTADIFQVGELVDVVGVSKGKGFQGGVKRHGFRGGPKTHGQSDRLRAPGAIGSTTTPGRVYKGTRMAGHMGHRRVTVSHLKVVLVDSERNLLAVRGAVPGPKNGLVLVKEARKQKTKKKK